jgi:rSAM/selenodomain-associated transferase 1
VSERLWIAAKAPRPGFVKTRLARSIGDDRAAELYVAFLQDLAVRFGDGQALGWYVTPDDGWPELRRLLPDQDGALVLGQGKGDWGERQRRLFAEANARGERRTVLIASDSPQLEPETVGQAFRALEQHDLVLGPVTDGGYYLIGMSGDHAEVLDGVRMSRETVLEEILERAEALGAGVALLEPTFDVDEGQDLELLRGAARGNPQLARTAAVLEELT